MTPVVVVAFVYGISYIVFVVVRESGDVGTLPSTIEWTYQLALPAIALALGVGMLQARMYTADALRRLALAVPDHASAERVRIGMADALEDPALRFAIQNGDGRWRDEHGTTSARCARAPGAR